MEIGVGNVGLSGQVAVGAGVFFDRQNNLSIGVFTAGGASTSNVAGFSIGASAGVFGTNARKVENLSGAGSTGTITLGAGALGYASETTSGNVRYGTGGVGAGYGFSISRYDTTTAAATIFGRTC